MSAKIDVVNNPKSLNIIVINSKNLPQVSRKLESHVGHFAVANVDGLTAEIISVTNNYEVQSDHFSANHYFQNVHGVIYPRGNPIGIFTSKFKSDFLGKISLSLNYDCVLYRFEKEEGRLVYDEGESLRREVVFKQNRAMYVKDYTFIAEGIHLQLAWAFDTIGKNIEGARRRFSQDLSQDELSNSNAIERLTRCMVLARSLNKIVAPPIS